MSSKIKLMNANGKELVIDSGSALEDKQIQASDIAYTRTTIEDMMNIPSPSNNEVCVVTEEGRGGTFVYDSAQSTVDNSGTIFNGWKRQYSGAVNISWFGTVGDGVADDTLAIQRLFSEVSGGKAICNPNDIYKVTNTLILNFDLNLNGSTINFILDGSKTCLDMRDNSSIYNGTINNIGINFSGAGQYQAPIIIGNYSNGIGYSNIEINKITINSNRPNGNGIVITGDSNNIIVTNIIFPNSSTIGRPILIHWGNADNPTLGTTHPYNIKIENIKCGVMDNTSIDGAAIFISSAYNIDIKNVIAKKVSWRGGLFSVFSGDYGNFYAPNNVKDLIMSNIVVSNLAVEEATEHLVKVDCLSTLAPTNTILQAPKMINISGKAGSSFACILIANCINGSLEDSNIGNGIVGVGTGEGVTGFTVKNTKIYDTQQSGINFTNSIKPPEKCKVEDCIIVGSNKGGNNYGQILLGTSKGCVAKNNILGKLSGETAGYGVRVDNTAIDSEVVGNHVVEAVNSSYSLGSSTTYDILKTFKDNTSDAAVIFQSGVGIVKMSTVCRGTNIQRECMGSTSAPTSGNWMRGDRIYSEAPSSGGTIGLVCTASGNPGTWKAFGTIAS